MCLEGKGSGERGGGGLSSGSEEDPAAAAAGGLKETKRGLRRCGRAAGGQKAPERSLRRPVGPSDILKTEPNHRPTVNLESLVKMLSSNFENEGTWWTSWTESRTSGRAC